jgi:hypothetical protein
MQNDWFYKKISYMARNKMYPVDLCDIYSLFMHSMHQELITPKTIDYIFKGIKDGRIIITNNCTLDWIISNTERMKRIYNPVYDPRDQLIYELLSQNLKSLKKIDKHVSEISLMMALLSSKNKKGNYLGSMDSDNFRLLKKYLG